MRFRATQTVYAIHPRVIEGSADEIIKEGRLRATPERLEKIRQGSFKGFMGAYGRHWEVRRIE